MTALTVLNAPRSLSQAPAPLAMPFDWGALGYAALLVASGILGGAAVGAGWGAVTKGKPSGQDFVTGAIGGAGVGMGVILSYAMRGRAF